MAAFYCADCGLRKSQDADFCLSCTGNTWVDYGTVDASMSKPALVRAEDGSYYPPANLFNRFFAWLIDGMIVCALMMMINLVSTMLHPETSPFHGGLEIFMLPSPLPIVVFGLYYIVFESSTFQGTPGKILLQLRVRDSNGNRLSVWQASVRYVTRWISSYFCYLGYSLVFMHPRKLGLHDFLAGTVVTDLMPMDTQVVSTAEIEENIPIPPVAEDQDYAEEQDYDEPMHLPESQSATDAKPHGVFKIDINYASELQLAQLPGMGPILAKKAVRVRAESGGFTSLDDFVYWVGLKPHHLDRIAPLISLSPFFASPSPSPSESDVQLTSVEAISQVPQTPSIDLNLADLAALQTLPGMTKAMAEYLILERERRKGFQSLEEAAEILDLTEAEVETFRQKACVTVLKIRSKKARLVDY